MSEVLKKIRDFMEKEGIPGRDAHDLPTSSKTFPDGTSYRIEIAGVERASTMEAMIAEANRRGIVVHRAIAAVGGSTYCEFEELKAMAEQICGKPEKPKLDEEIVAIVKWVDGTVIDAVRKVIQ